jgi:hypothetical protein
MNCGGMKLIIRHSFKLLPNIGKHIVELIEGTLSSDLAHAWRWRPGGDALKSRRAAPARDLADMPGWNHDTKIGQDSIKKPVDSLIDSLDSVKIRSQL